LNASSIHDDQPYRRTGKKVIIPLYGIVLQNQGPLGFAHFGENALRHGLLAKRKMPESPRKL
jgi:hypothetical protein